MWDPWTQRFEVSWKPEVRFLQKKLDVLAAIQDSGDLRSFREEDPDIAVRIKDRFHEMVYGPTRLVLGLAGPKTDRAALDDVLKLLLDEYQPAAFGRATCTFQYLIPLTGDYDDLRTGFAYKMFPQLEAAEWIDPAVLLDYRAKDLPWVGGMEFGVVREAEIPSRLARREGRMQGALAGPDLQDAPELAFFVDSSWHSEKPVGDGQEPLAGICETWDTMSEKVSQIVKRIHDSVFANG